MRHVSVVLTLTSSGQEGSLSTVGMLASMCGVAEKKADGSATQTPSDPWKASARATISMWLHYRNSCLLA